ncbi:hypothetical protein F2Q68_00013352 [Brassica cretica]|uniref:Fucosyltransferase n=1 Tax=Brassica cretica TaxID=69181 RepID=A0A8S9HNH2_BRACR|nr:hypothetical protein F2Q68_00013352 [Brassica cretica]
MLLSLFIISNHQLLDAITINVPKDSGKPREDKLLGGLLSEEFDEGSCLSRYQSSLYRKPSPYEPSQYLVSKLRSYEMLHKRCGPGTEAYKRAAEQLGDDSRSVGECRYIVWVAVHGLGNRIVSLVSTFLYALLTERVLLVDQRTDMKHLFCEPFPGTSWLLPFDFPLMGQLDSSCCYGTMLKTDAINSTTTGTIPSYLYLYLIHDYEDHDKMFFCERDQNVIRQVPWLVSKSNQYFVPSLWLIPSFQTELIKLFPRKDTVFHHLVRYLLHPTNQVWGLITRFYNAYLSRADETFVTNKSTSPKLKAVLVTSLYPEYSEKLRTLYWESPSSTGDMVQVYQPSQEMFQQTDEKLHDQKALAEMYLLSLTDNLVTSGLSTFGYVAQSLGGLKAWILYRPTNHTTPDPPRCEEWTMGLKLVDSADVF